MLHPSANARLHRHLAMATEFHLYLDSSLGDSEAYTLAQAVFAEVDRVEEIFSRFRRSSEISRLNELAALGPVVTDPEVFGLLARARALWEKSGGAFDLALGRLSRAWGFADRAPHLPTAEELAEAQAASGMEWVRLDPDWRTVEFARAGIELDLGAFAKGYAVDCALGVLHAAGIAGLIDAGHSSLAASGEPFSSAWRIEVNAPALGQDEARTIDAIALGCRALGSSGIMEQKFEAGDRIYSHLLDPRKNHETGQRRQMLQTTVLAATAAEADALSTALFVLGPEQGRALVDAEENCAALWLYEEDGRVGVAARKWPHKL